MLKSCRVEDDIRNNLFTRNVIASKRTKNAKKLKHGNFTYDIYKTKQTGFLTNNPLKRTIALEKYVEKSDGTRYRWMNKIDMKGNNTTDSKILIYFNITNMITLNINYTSGVIMVIGALFKKWISQEFPKVCDELQNAVRVDTQTKFENLLIPDDTKKGDPVSNEENNESKKEDVEETKYPQTTSNYDLLWEECAKLRNSITAIQTWSSLYESRN